MFQFMWDIMKEQHQSQSSINLKKKLIRICRKIIKNKYPNFINNLNFYLFKIYLNVVEPAVWNLW